jgi:hypothetical protein
VARVRFINSLRFAGGTHTASVVLRTLREAFPDAAGPLQGRAIMALPRPLFAL